MATLALAQFFLSFFRGVNGYFECLFGRMLNFKEWFTGRWLELIKFPRQLATLLLSDIMR